jgi:cytochrome c oxidase subunit 3
MSEEAATITTNTDVFEGHSIDVKVRTKKMMMWFIIFAIVMLFAGITSALIVLKGKLLWVHFNVPTALWISNLLVIASSVSMVLTLKSLKSGAAKQKTFGLALVTLLLGIGFVITQNAGWQNLKAHGMGYTITLDDQGLKKYSWNTLGKLNGTYGTDYYLELHGEKLVLENGEYYATSDAARAKPLTNQVMTTFNAAGAMISVLIYVHIIHLFFGLIYMAVNVVRIHKMKLNQENWISLHTGGMYWHFMGILWLYLFAFVFFLY